MTSDQVVEALLGLLSLTVGYLAFRFATRAASEQGKAAVIAVDAAAYERAKNIYESALETLRTELGEGRRDLSAARADIDSLRADNTRLHRELDSVQRELRQLKRDTSTPPGGNPRL